MKKAFTLVELLVVIVAVTVLVVAMGYVSGCGVGGALAEARAASCQANLKTIGNAFREYERKNSTFARIHTTGDAAAKYAPTGTNNNFRDIAAAPMNEPWALVAAGLIPENAFKCGGDRDWEPRVVDMTTVKTNGWSSDKQFSYGIQFPYDKNPQGTQSAGDPAIDSGTTGGLSSNSVFMADMPKRGAADPIVKKAGDYQNHGDGICYLTQAGNVGFHVGPGLGSVINGDEIYADARSGDGICPASSTDAVICPGAIDGK